MTVTCRYDYIRGTGSAQSPTEIEDLLSSLDSHWGLTGHPFWSGKSYAVGFKSVLGVSGGYSFNSNTDKFDYLLDLSGQYCSAHPDQFDLCRLLFSQLKFTRVDIALDDYSRRSTFEEVEAAGRRGDFALLDTFKVIASGVRGGRAISTCYFGSSDKIIRFYDADFIHGIGADRWEFQYRGDYPNVIMAEFLSGTSLASLAVASIDFLDRSSPAANLERLSRLPFWQSILDEVGGGVSLSPRRVTRSVDKIQAWIESQVAPSLSILKYGWGENKFSDYLDKLCHKSLDRLSPFQLAMIEELKECQKLFY